MLNFDPGKVSAVTALLAGRVGDLIVATPFLKSLRARYPKARIRLVAGESCAQVVPLIPWVDETLYVRRWVRPLRNAELGLRLFRGPCDLLADLNPAFSKTSAALVWSARSPRKLAFARGRPDRLFDRLAAAPGEREHMLDRYARLAAELGAPYEPVPELRLSSADECKADALLPEASKKDGLTRVLIHPGNFKKFDNRWPEEKFIALTDLLAAENHVRVFYLAGPGEARKVEEIVSRLKRPARLLPPAPLGVTGALMRRMDLCVMNITGTTHLAAALGAATFGLYSGYTHAVWRPRGSRHSGVVSPSWESCRGISVEEAWAALKTALSALGR